MSLISLLYHQCLLYNKIWDYINCSNSDFNIYTQRTSEVDISQTGLLNNNISTKVSPEIPPIIVLSHDPGSISESLIVKTGRFPLSLVPVKFTPI